MLTNLFLIEGGILDQTTFTRLAVMVMHKKRETERAQPEGTYFDVV